MLLLKDLLKNDTFKSDRFKFLLGELNRLLVMVTTKEFLRIVEETLKVAPVGFWVRECSLKYHPKNERGLHGNLIHSIKVAKLTLVIARSCSYNRQNTDRVLSAAILHDVCRHGLDGRSKYSEKEHPRLVRQLMFKHSIGMNSPAKEEVLEDIEKHMGRWDSVSYTPILVPSEILHLADVIDAKEEDWRLTPY